MPLFSCNVAIAGEWTLGGAFLVQSTPYKGVKSEDYITPLPVINYEGERVYLHTLSAGYYVWKSPQNTISLDATYSPQFFHPKENDDTAMRQLRPHRDTVMAGTTYSHLANWGTLRASIATDMLGISNGIRADGAYLYPFSGDQWELISGFGVIWNSPKQNRYEYGITQHESRRSGLAEYQPKGSWSPYIELSGQYRFTDRWAMFALTRIERVPSTIKDSPMVNKSVSSMVWTGLTYTF
nr:MipA/OmpV family protein [Providencia sp. PROV117]